MTRTLPRQEIRSALTGPFGSIRTPVNRDGSGRKGSGRKGSGRKGTVRSAADGSGRKGTVRGTARN